MAISPERLKEQAAEVLARTLDELDREVARDYMTNHEISRDLIQALIDAGFRIEG